MLLVFVFFTYKCKVFNKNVKILERERERERFYSFNRTRQALGFFSITPIGSIGFHRSPNTTRYLVPYSEHTTFIIFNSNVQRSYMNYVDQKRKYKRTRSKV
jgi:hypothetical protein